jgi:TolB-like protein/DNA-binding winged helix-turn-helix (wHTH) protein
VAPITHNFGDFELDSARFELRRNGRHLKLERIPLELLILLVERDGQVVSRQEIVERLWGKDVFLDTEHGINTAIRKIRRALREDVERPRFIQTVSGKGYRFVQEVRGKGAAAARKTITPATEVFPPSKPDVLPTSARRHSKIRWLAAAMGSLMVAGAMLALNVAGMRDRVFATPQISPIHSIAVLPLTNLSGDPTQEYFADGITDEMITALANNRSLRVVSRTSAMQYKGVNKPLREIAQGLAVDGILEGSVNRSGNRVHVNLQLIYAPTDTHVWAQSYDRDLSSAMSLPDELSQTIAVAAKVAPTPVRAQRAIKPEAHDAYLHGRYFWFAENGDRGREYFKRAIDIQPDYAAAWDGLGDTYAEQAVGGEIPPQAAFAKADEFVSKALALDDSLAEVHNSMAAMSLFHKWDFQHAEAESLRAIELNPNYAEGRFIHSYILLVTNREDEALQEEIRANDISAFERPWALGLLYIHLRRYDDAIRELRSREKTELQNGFVGFLLSKAYWLKGSWKESEDELERANRLIDAAQLAEAEHRAFERGGEKAVDQLGVETVLKQSRKSYVSPCDIAQAYAFVGDKEHTLRYLELAYHERSPWIIFVQKDPVYDFLHSDQRYRALVKKIGLPPTY